MIPHRTDIEQALLGSILLSNDAFDRVSDFLTAAHFYDEAHQKIFEVCASLIRGGHKADFRTIPEHLVGIKVPGGNLDDYITALTLEATTSFNAAEYGQLIYGTAVRRTLILLADQMAEDARFATADIPPAQLIEAAEQKLFQIADTGRFGSGFQTFDQSVTEAIDMASRAYQRDGNLSGLSTGFSSLDEKLGGLQDSDLIILAGRPGMGKSAAAANIAYNVAKGQGSDDGKSVGFFSLEMSAEQLTTRIIGEKAEIPSSLIRRGGIRESDFERISDVGRGMKRLPLFIDQTGGLSIVQLAARARRLKRQSGLSLLVIDYLQLMRGSGKRSDNRVQEITEITTSLKALAKELCVPIIALSQLNRGVESRDDKRPQLSDLRESGSIEQDADVVIFLYRAEYYHQMRKPPEGNREEFSKWLAEGIPLDGKADAIIAKQRHGPTGNVELGFDAKLTRFSDLAERPRYYGQ